MIQLLVQKYDEWTIKMHTLLLNISIFKKIFRKYFATFGSRFDNHSLAENEDSHRLTLAYLFDDKLTKIKSSYGTGFRYPSLYEFYFYQSGSGYDGNEKLKIASFDIGVKNHFRNG